MTWKELEALIPHLFIVSIVILALVSRILDYLKHKQKTTLAIKLLETDPKIDVDLLKSIIQPISATLTDLRRGILLITISIACLIFAGNMMDPEYKYALRGLSAFPGMMGLMYVIFHYLAKNNNSNKDH